MFDSCSLNFAAPAFVSFANSLNSFSSTPLKLEHDLPCMRFFNSGDIVFSKSGQA
jgi:hypothetical protein